MIGITNAQGGSFGNNYSITSTDITPKVWLPLEGTLENYGSNNNISIANVNAVVTNDGRAGQGYQFGTGTSYLTLPAETMTSFTTEATVCFWIKIITWDTAWATYFQAGLSSNPWNQYTFGFLRNNTNSTCCFAICNGSTSSQTSYLTPTLDLNVWYHVALCYKTGFCTIYINGQHYQTYSTNIVPNFAGITHITIGACSNRNGSYQTNCILNDFRIYDKYLDTQDIQKIINGPIVKIDNHTVFLLTDTLTDQSKNNFLITNNGVTVSSNIMRDGRESLYFNGSSTYLRASKEIARIGTADWTIEYWMFPQVNKSSGVIYYQNGGNVSYNGGTASDNPFGILMGYGFYSPFKALYMGNSESTGYGNSISEISMGNNTQVNRWIHYAIVRCGDLIKCFENGNLIFSRTYNQTIPTPVADITIGWYHYNGTSYNVYEGYLQDLRVSDIARYSSNFLPPKRYV